MLSNLRAKFSEVQFEFEVLPSTMRKSAVIGISSMYGGFPVNISMIVHPKLLYHTSDSDMQYANDDDQTHQISDKVEVPTSSMT